MRVLINRLTTLRQKTGIGHYVAQLLAALRASARGDQVDVYPGGWEARSLQRFSQPPGPKTSSRRDSRLGRLLHSLGRTLSSWHFRLCYGWRRFDLYHEPNAIPLASPWPTIATVCDLSVLLHPQWHPADRAAYYERHFPDGIRRCVHLLTISEFSRGEIVRHFGVPAERVTVTYPGVHSRWRPLPGAVVESVRVRLNLPRTYLLHVGTLEPRKNLDMLIRAYARLPAAQRERCPLVLVGGWGWNVGGLRDFLATEGPRLGILHRGYVPDDDLPAVYNGARALVFPSHYEGFGLPPLEMLACGGAVVASTTGAVAEVVGSQAHLVDPHDEAGWVDALGRLIDDDDWREALRDGGRAHAAAFTWERCAAQTWSVYRTAVTCTAAVA